MYYLVLMIWLYEEIVVFHITFPFLLPKKEGNFLWENIDSSASSRR